MDIKHFSYFTTIVECGYNLSAAAKKIHISQSALSKIVTSFEQEEGVRLFSRVNGRLSSLTPAGELFYSACMDISTRYDDMMEQVRLLSRLEKGTVKLGIPPLVVSLLFSNAISAFSQAYPDINLELVEEGAEELCRRFVNNDLDFAAVLAPTNLNPAIATEHTIHLDELSAFMTLSHPLSKKSFLTWQDLEPYPLAIFNDTFSINRYLYETFKREKVKPNIALKSASWDFLVEAVSNSSMITILPSPIKSLIHGNKYVEVPFQKPIIWQVVLVEHTRNKLTGPQHVFKDFTLNYMKAYTDKQE